MCVSTVCAPAVSEDTADAASALSHPARMQHQNCHRSLKLVFSKVSDSAKVGCRNSGKNSALSPTALILHQRRQRHH